jgi:predicted transcriptional regulator
MSERFDIRLSEEEKARLAELAKQKGVSMTDLVRTWITRGDIIHVLAEQLQDISNDFDRWLVLENRGTCVRNLCDELRNRLPPDMEQWKHLAIYTWIEFFNRSFELMKNSVSKSKHTIDLFIRQSEPKQKEVLVELMMTFKQNVTLYNSVFIEGFIDILQIIDGKYTEDASARYNDGLRVRYNEITSKFEDFLKRAQRELGDTFEQVMPRAREFRRKEKV